MRQAFSDQQRLDFPGVLGVQLNLDCRDEIIPILRALQQIYSRPKLRQQILELIAQDVNEQSRDDVGREGMDYWQILVLAAVRLGCNLDYDKLQDLAEQHRALRHIMGLGDWEAEDGFGWRRIRDNLCLLKPATIEKISHLIVAEGHRLQPEAVNCPECGVKVEQVPWSDGKHTLTTTYRWFLAGWARRLSWQQVAAAFHTSWDKVHASVEHAVSWGLAHRELKDVQSIGVDEVQWQRGHKYLTLVYQIDAGCKRLLWIGQERREESLRKFFDQWGCAVLPTLRFICSDMWQ